MTKKILIYIFAILIFAFNIYGEKTEAEGVGGYSLTQEDIDRIKATTWEINLKTDVKNTIFDSIQYSIWENDPIPMFKEQRELRKKINNDKKQTKLDIEMEKRVDWDITFKEVTGDMMYLVKSKTSKKDTFTVVSSNPAKKFWVVTKIVDKKDGSFSAWLIPIEPVIGQSMDVIITDENAFDINSL